jgi:hypothetical protein
VTDDVKEDWWQRVNGETVGPRPELVEEYYERTDGQRIHFYTPRRFLEYAREQGESISDATVAEASRVSDSRSRVQALGKAWVAQALGSPATATFYERVRQLAEQQNAEARPGIVEAMRRLNELNNSTLSQLSDAELSPLTQATIDYVRKEDERRRQATNLDALLKKARELTEEFGDTPMSAITDDSQDTDEDEPND